MKPRSGPGLGARFFSGDDLATFFANYLPEAAATSFALAGDNALGDPPGLEAMLDAEYMPALGKGGSAGGVCVWECCV